MTFNADADTEDLKIGKFEDEVTRKTQYAFAHARILCLILCCCVNVLLLYVVDCMLLTAC